MDKVQEDVAMTGALCSLHSSEPIKYSTINRGTIMVGDSCVSVIGNIQPAAVHEALNNIKRKDHVGLWNRCTIF